MIIFFLLPILLFIYKHNKPYLKNKTKLITDVAIYQRKINGLQVYYCDKKCRLGSKNDGGYVIGLCEGNYDCYISADVSNEESFSRDFILKYDTNKLNSYAFDGTITDYPYKYTDKITFFKKNIDNFNDEHHTNIDNIIQTHNDIFLKMDIEGGEYKWLIDADVTKFKQMVIEFHGINDDTWGASLETKVKCLEKLALTHYLIHAHGNNHSSSENKIPDVIELTYIHKKCFRSKPHLNTQALPSIFDGRNMIRCQDIDLNFYPFKV